jgi:hypothetical protein
MSIPRILFGASLFLLGLALGNSKVEVYYRLGGVALMFIGLYILIHGQFQAGKGFHKPVNYLFVIIFLICGFLLFMIFR